MLLIVIVSFYNCIFVIFSWQGLVGLVGPQGEEGAKGEPGPQGLKGEPGPLGPTGERVSMLFICTLLNEATNK